MMLKLTVLSLFLGFMNVVARRIVVEDPPDINKILQAKVAQGQTTLNEMFREVEILMEDTQQKLEEAVHQMENETARSMSYAHSFPSYPNEIRTDGEVGDESIHRIDRMDKESDNSTRETHFSRALIRTSGQWNEVDHECMVDEDCETDSFCLYEILISKCTPCKTANEVCMKDEQCCGEQMCVWGVCSSNRTRGESGTICQYQSDCSPWHCCAFHKALLFPVCRPRPLEGQPCHGHPNLLMELLLWDTEGPRESCPCAGDLQCLPNRHEARCVAERSIKMDGGASEPTVSDRN